MAPGDENVRDRYFNGVLAVDLRCGVLEIFTWTFRPIPPCRLGLLSPSSLLQLCVGLRGYGWNWSPPKSRAPQEWCPTSSATRLVIATTLSLLLYSILYDVVHIHIQYIAPGPWQSPWGAPILPPSGYPNPRPPTSLSSPASSSIPPYRSSTTHPPSLVSPFSANYPASGHLCMIASVKY